MIDITKLYCSRSTTGDSLRYGRKPVIAWNAIRTCNLNCVHCYTDFRRRPYSDELSNAEAQAMIDDLAGFGAPGLLFSGGKPLMREDVLELVDYARQLGIRPVLSTNGTLITPAVAGRMKRAGLTCVGISLDGTGEVEDRFRGRKGAFETAMEGFRNCVAAGRRGIAADADQEKFSRPRFHLRLHRA